MVGELSVSHTYVSGGDTGPLVNPPAPAVSAGLLGADLEADPQGGLYRFARIYGPTPYYSEIETPLGRPDVDVKEGDYLIAINGQTVKVAGQLLPPAAGGQERGGDAHGGPRPAGSGAPQLSRQAGRSPTARPATPAG